MGRNLPILNRQHTRGECVRGSRKCRDGWIRARERVRGAEDWGCSCSDDCSDGRREWSTNNRGCRDGGAGGREGGEEGEAGESETIEC